MLILGKKAIINISKITCIDLFLKFFAVVKCTKARPVGLQWDRSMFIVDFSIITKVIWLISGLKTPNFSNSDIYWYQKTNDYIPRLIQTIMNIMSILLIQCANSRSQILSLLNGFQLQSSVNFALHRVVIKSTAPTKGSSRSDLIP